MKHVWLLFCGLILPGATLGWHESLSEASRVFSVHLSNGNPVFEEVVDPQIEPPRKHPGDLLDKIRGWIPPLHRQEPRRFDNTTIHAHLKSEFRQRGPAMPLFFRVDADVPLSALKDVLKTARDYDAKFVFVLVDFDGGRPLYECIRLSVQSGEFDIFKPPPIGSPGLTQ